MEATQQRPPLPPFDRDSAVKKVRLAEDAWNTRDPERVSLSYTVDSLWRNRAEFITGRGAIVQFLRRKWNKELDYRLIKELWAVNGDRIAVRFAYEWHDDSGHWFRSYGNENWEFDGDGLMRRRHASINDLPMVQVFTSDKVKIESCDLLATGSPLPDRSALDDPFRITVPIVVGDEHTDPL